MSSVSGIKAGRAYVELGANDSELQRVLKRAENRINATAKTIRTIGLSLAAVGTAVAAPLAYAAIAAGKHGDAINDMAVKTGMAVEDLAAFDLAASQNGVSMESLVTSVNRMQRVIVEAADGSKEAANAFDELGITLAELQSLTPARQFELIAEKISKLPDAGRRTAAAWKIFGKSGAELLPILARGARGMQEYREMSDRLGHTIAFKTVSAIGEFDDMMARVNTQLKDVKEVAGAAIASALLPYEDAINNILKSTIEWVAANGDLIVSIGSIGGVSLAAGFSLLGISAALNIVAVAIKTVAAAATLLSANPVIALGLAVAAVAAGTVAYARIASRANYDISTSAQAATRATDEARAADLARVDSLQKLADSGKLNDAQMGAASSIIAQLESSYGPLGVTIDKTTGSIQGMADAWERVTKSMRGNAIADVQAEIEAIQKQIGAAENTFKENNNNWWDGFDRVGLSTIRDALLGNPITQAEIEKAMGANEITSVVATLYTRMQEANKRLQALKAGSKDALTGGLPGGPQPGGRTTVDIDRQASFLESLAIDRARATGDNQLAGQLEILRDFKKTLEEIVDIGLQGPNLKLAVDSSFDIASAKWDEVRKVMERASSYSVGVFNPRALGSLNQSGGVKTVERRLAENNSQNQDIIAQLKNIAANIVPTYEQ